METRPGNWSLETFRFGKGREQPLQSAMHRRQRQPGLREKGGMTRVGCSFSIKRIG
jgi:hypothetical protein